EELGIVIDDSALTPLGFAGAGGQSGRSIALLLYRCREWAGEPRCLEAEAIEWFAPHGFAVLPMPPLDIDLVRDVSWLTN
ncbi:MAG: (deoxy)nucleoside triphosphate pyrophosphohydrolase, partial [Novosphingobium sp.]